MVNSSPVPGALAIFGTASDVGKSIVATALCRMFSNAGIDVAPYKAQNMSNNSGVTPDGCEIGRAQIAQAEAARVVPTADMNPVLLKPNSDTGAQIVLQGKVCSTETAKGYFLDTSLWAEAARKSLDQLMQRHELVVIEGAGSCAEMNLYDRDFVNFRTARISGAPVILVADIDRGGVFAQVVGTLAVLPPEDRALVKGVIINRFRGDIDLFRDGVKLIETLAGIPVLGVIPYFRGFRIDAEDAVPLSSKVDPSGAPEKGRIAVAAIYFPHISNFTDLSPLELDPKVELHYLHFPRSLRGYQALILPGTKNVRGDLDWLTSLGWAEKIREFRRDGGLIMGICGGYQMLGATIADPSGVEGEPGESAGLGMLPVHTVLEEEKCLSNAIGNIQGESIAVSGYEIHMGRTTSNGDCSSFLRVTARNNRPADDVDGVITPDGKVIGTYFHGIIDEPEVRCWFLRQIDPAYTPDAEERGRQESYDLLADHFSGYLDIPKLYEIIQRPCPNP
ncbi:cobyric acid synthase [Chlorobium phaeobacteroides]|jgi:adenosylcobyric acid synthase|uniref:Cobyric acid synthase n=1 Tax=Chlorobium phaeobacteroides (strain DSM 266 / SMG 266 / 2430) TaxID=290317 RepID=COBQ_CHLPD|nr:cobyric acid synthase [Chlorobium phaeobacteroides]A1BFI0.1 RecName: Full=Cobyric acid synthase [Chlorobium phaeobacteroides DSM 266]ABL65157.1 adenosylcobyric acid synthase (glutamine-hydrolysing) [Chlorobium phaeobacteroides DSM 266]MBV5326844.1 cobyric acid synthase [Chlorobium sp.]